MSPSIFDFLAGGFFQTSWLLALLVFAIVAQITMMSVTLYLHRCQAHRAVDLHPIIAHFFRFWAWFTTAMVTKDWVAIHRKHHAHVETLDDPHSPHAHGIINVAIHGVVLYQKARKQPEIMQKYGQGTPDDWLERYIYSPFPSLGPTLLLFVYLFSFGAMGLTLWAAQMLVIPVGAAGIINGLGHWWGYRNFVTPDKSTNLTPWGLIIGGEELHNNHHAFPSSAKFSLRKFEFDIGWAVLRVLQFLRLAKVQRVAPTLAQRPNIAVADMETMRAVIAHRFQLMKDYFRLVTVPVMRAEAEAAGESLNKIKRRFQRALADNGRWLDESGQQRLSQWVEKQPSLQIVCEYRDRLHELFERSSRSTEARLEALRQWCADAEASGIAALEEFSARIRAYALSPVAYGEAR